MIVQRAGRAAAIVALFAGLTAIMTWPQALHLASQAAPHQDIYFNLWRLRWFAHAIVTPSARLFDANIFYPETGTFALSDAMLVEGVVGAPLLWLRVPPVLVHNILLLGAIALSGAVMFALVRYLTGSRGAAALAGIVFAFAPYRFEHIMHMELQWTIWIPLAFLAMHRTLDTGSWKYGLATGACIALQMMSSIYYGIYLASLLPLGALLMLRDARAPLRAILAALAAGALLASALSLAYAQPYLRVRERTGDRPGNEVRQFSALPESYLIATPSNSVYGVSAPLPADDELQLFPGIVPVLLAGFGLFRRSHAIRPLVYLVLLMVAVEMSLGVHGFTYPWLYRHIMVYRGLRAPARAGLFFLMFLGVLAGYGYQRLARGRSVSQRTLLVAVLSAAVLVEYHVSITLSEFPNTAPPIYRLLESQPPGPVVEFPLPRRDSLPYRDAEYSYMSTFHWFPLVNGYSGVFPRSYLTLLDRLQSFPDESSIRRLRAIGVRYLIVHGSTFRAVDWLTLHDGLAQLGVKELGRFDDAVGEAALYQVQ